MAAALPRVKDNGKKERQRECRRAQKNKTVIDKSANESEGESENKMQTKTKHMGSVR